MTTQEILMYLNQHFDSREMWTSPFGDCETEELMEEIGKNLDSEYEIYDDHIGTHIKVDGKPVFDFVG